MQLLQDRVSGCSHLKGLQLALCAATKWSMRCTICLTLVNEPRRMALSVN